MIYDNGGGDDDGDDDDDDDDDDFGSRLKLKAQVIHFFLSVVARNRICPSTRSLLASLALPLEDHGIL